VVRLRGERGVDADEVTLLQQLLEACIAEAQLRLDLGRWLAAVVVERRTLKPRVRRVTAWPIRGGSE